MAQNYISISEKIKRIHKMFTALPALEFDYSVNDYYGYWYAEDRLYLICDCMVQAYYFVEANSPKEAVDKVLKRHEEAMHAGEWVDESIE